MLLYQHTMKLCFVTSRAGGSGRDQGDEVRDSPDAGALCAADEAAGAHDPGDGESRRQVRA